MYKHVFHENTSVSNNLTNNSSLTESDENVCCL